ncbi:hypothetical protein PV08_05269 [Exophiala spinifera]|uniref:Rhodopsin domain-containing protein n=1 Tax=Exophiala spinifera TaxID=91928 RepID=A0A0D2BVC6_9EURO|nr:uncharacterized protein PV08_05269 [Exophiala spinifera]KIW15224.1 hypothetical protein PV08_05269 [Exophiala spinifera]
MIAMRELVVRVPLISATKKGPVVNLVSWVSLATLCLAVITVLLSKLVVLRRLMWTDSIIATAMLFAIGFTIAINNQVSRGLGSQLSTVRSEDYEGFQKAGYAWNMLYIITMSFGKLSTLSLLLALAPNKSYHRIPMLALVGFIGLWTVATLFASAFQCALPHPYLITTETCFNQTGFWDTIGIVNILTDIAIMAMPILLVYGLHLSSKKKVAVCFAFSFRLGAVACTIWRLTEIHRFFDRGTDITFNSWLPTIATILELFFSVFSACVPHLRPFMDSIQAGYLSGVASEDGRFGYGNDSYLMGKTARSKVAVASGVRSHAFKSDDRSESLDLPRQGIRAENTSDHSIGRALTSSNRVVIQSGRGSKAQKIPSLSDSHPKRRSNSVTSNGGRSDGSDGSKAMIIKTTKEWSVSYQDV